MLHAGARKILLQHGVMRWLLSGGPIGSAPECKEEGNHGILCWIGHLDERDAHLRGGPQWQGRCGDQGANFAWGRAGEGEKRWSVIRTMPRHWPCLPEAEARRAYFNSRSTNRRNSWIRRCALPPAQWVSTPMMA